MSNGEESTISLHQVHLVKNLIERCLQLYMSQGEVVNKLFNDAKIEPNLTRTVWEQLKAENQEFFRVYYTRLIVKDQILRFNQLLERQVELMQQMGHTQAPLTHLSNGSQTHSMHRNSAYRYPQPHVPSINPENTYQVVSAVHHDYTNGIYSPQQYMQVAANMFCHAGRMDFPAHVPLVQNSNAGIMQGLSEGTIKAEDVYAGNSSVMFGADFHLLEPHTVIREASISPFNGGESCSQSFNESLLENEMNSFGPEQMTQNFSLSDLTTEFSNSTVALDSYSRSPCPGTNANFSNPHIWLEDQEFRRFETTMSEGFSYDGFGSS